MIGIEERPRELGLSTELDAKYLLQVDTTSAQLILRIFADLVCRVLVAVSRKRFIFSFSPVGTSEPGVLPGPCNCLCKGTYSLSWRRVILPERAPSLIGIAPTIVAMGLSTASKMKLMVRTLVQCFCESVKAYRIVRRGAQCK